MQNEKKNAGRVGITVWNSYLSAKINQKDKNLFVVTDRGDWVKIKSIFFLKKPTKIWQHSQRKSGRYGQFFEAFLENLNFTDMEDAL